MRVLCDVHIPYRLVTFLRQRGVDATHVNRILGKWHTTDAAICDYVDDTDSVLITKDAASRVGGCALPEDVTSTYAVEKE